MTATLAAPKAAPRKRPAKVAAPVATGTPTVSILTALDTALSNVRAANPDVPTALAVVIATGSGKKHGHFAPASWLDTEGAHKGSARHEILMSSESLARGAVATLTTLIHEAAHAANHATGTKDTSRQGRYHNKDFRDRAEAFGLTTESHDTIGFITTGMQSWALEAYASDLAALEAVLVTHHVLAKKATKPANTVKLGCECVKDNGNPLTVTVPVPWFDACAPFCGTCGQALTPVG